MKKELKKDVGKRLRQFRNKTGLTQRKISTYFDIGRANYSRIETGEVFPGIAMLNVLQDKFNLSVDWLVGERGEMVLTSRSKDSLLEDIDLETDEVKELFLSMSRVPLVKHAVLCFFLEFKTRKKQIIDEYLKKSKETSPKGDDGKK